jgi:hypothetical protein
MHIIDNLYIEDIPVDCINECSASGDCEPSCRQWMAKLDFTVDANNARKFIRAQGIEDSNKMDNETLAMYVLWIACGNFNDQLYWQQQNPGADPHDSDCGTDMISLTSY